MSQRDLSFDYTRSIVKSLRHSIIQARFRKVGFWLYQVHFPGFGVQKLHYFHCVFLSARWIAVNLMSQGFSYLSNDLFMC